jgi:hypothetical protein
MTEPATGAESSSASSGSAPIASLSPSVSLVAGGSGISGGDMSDAPTALNVATTVVSAGVDFLEAMDTAGWNFATAEPLREALIAYFVDAQAELSVMISAAIGAQHRNSATYQEGRLSDRAPKVNLAPSPAPRPHPYAVSPEQPMTEDSATDQPLSASNEPVTKRPIDQASPGGPDMAPKPPQQPEIVAVEWAAGGSSQNDVIRGEVVAQTKTWAKVIWSTGRFERVRLNDKNLRWLTAADVAAAPVPVTGENSVPGWVQGMVGPEQLEDLRSDARAMTYEQLVAAEADLANARDERLAAGKRLELAQQAQSLTVEELRRIGNDPSTTPATRSPATAELRRRGIESVRAADLAGREILYFSDDWDQVQDVRSIGREQLLVRFTNGEEPIRVHTEQHFLTRCEPSKEHGVAAAEEAQHQANRRYVEGQVVRQERRRRDKAGSDQPSAARFTDDPIAWLVEELRTCQSTDEVEALLFAHTDSRADLEAVAVASGMKINYLHKSKKDLYDALVRHTSGDWSDTAAGGADPSAKPTSQDPS